VYNNSHNIGVCVCIERENERRETAGESQSHIHSDGVRGSESTNKRQARRVSDELSAFLKLKGAGPVKGRVELRAILCQRACRKREGAHRLSDEFMGPTGCCIAKAEICDVNNR